MSGFKKAINASGAGDNPEDPHVLYAEDWNKAVEVLESVKKSSPLSSDRNFALNSLQFSRDDYTITGDAVTIDSGVVQAKNSQTSSALQGAYIEFNTNRPQSLHSRPFELSFYFKYFSYLSNRPARAGIGARSLTWNNFAGLEFYNNKTYFTVHSYNPEPYRIEIDNITDNTPRRIDLFSDDEVSKITMLVDGEEVGVITSDDIAMPSDRSVGLAVDIPQAYPFDSLTLSYWSLLIKDL